MSVIAGLKSKDGYLFLANNSTGGPGFNGDIVRFSKYCGGLTLTSNADQLQRLRGLLERFIEENTVKDTDDFNNVVDKTVLFLKTEFRNDSAYRSLPLTFLLLVVGTDRAGQGDFEYVYIRHRVSERTEKDGGTEYRTVFDVKPAVPAGDIFYGNSGLIEYLAGKLHCSDLSIAFAKLLACFSVEELNSREGTSICDQIKMASLSSEHGFDFIRSEEVCSLMRQARKASPMLVEGFSAFLSGTDLDEAVTNRR